MITRVSVEPSRRCSKGCAFCYNGSSPDGADGWSADELVAFAEDCAKNGVESLSIGGGEPLEYVGLYSVLAALDGVLARTLTTNGILLEDPAALDRLVAARPDKVHVSIHSPENPREVERAATVVLALDARGVHAGVNLLVRRSRLEDATRAYAALLSKGFTPGHIVLLPLRAEGERDTPSPEEVARVANGTRFQAMSCLSGCKKSERFASIGYDKSAAWCSYTRSRRVLRSLEYRALVEALDGLELERCATGLVRLGAARSVRE
ncbi:MAG: radical SAM protein [Myxococcales bacterium]|nr:radical SAM protein [Myxococcales bacterium]